MPRIFDRRTGRTLGTISDLELEQLRSIFEESVQEDEPSVLNPELLAALVDAGVSDRLLTILQQVGDADDAFVLGWDAD